MSPSEAPTSLRLDKWLWFARFARTRSLAAKLCTGGLVAVGGAAVAKANHAVRVGDTVTVQQGRVVRRVTVAALGARRGPASEARLLYHEPEPPRPVEPAATARWTSLFGDDAWEDGSPDAA